MEHFMTLRKIRLLQTNKIRRGLVTLIFTICILGISGLLTQAKDRFFVITWGENSADWNRTLGLTGLRFGCSDAPASCTREANRLASSQNVSQLFVATLLNPSRIVSDAQAYSGLSLTSKVLYEVGFDDFVGQSQKTKLDGRALSSLVSDVARQLKSQNYNLKFGITLYADELTNGELERLALDNDARQTVDFIHLYLHYRKQNNPFQTYVEHAEQLFPNAKIIAGSYAYDRREYLPCSPGNSARCSDGDEREMFNKTLQEQLDLARAGAINGIEFYPGLFGREDSWKQWDNPRFCRQEERKECLQTTQSMRQTVKKLLGAIQ